MIRPIGRKSNRGLLATTLLVTGLIAGCGGSGSSGGTSSTGTTSTATTTAAESVSTSKSMATTSETALTSASTSATTADAAEGAALSAGATSQVTATNDLLATTNTYLASTKAEITRAATTSYTKTIGGLTVTVAVTAQTLTTASFTISLNGSLSGSGTVTSYTNFVFASGTVTRASNGGKAGTNFNISYNEQAASGTSLFATSNSWANDDGTGIGSLTFAASATTTTWSYDSAGDWIWNVYQNGSATTGVLRAAVAVNADGSGSAKLYCATDTLLRSSETWTASATGQFCTYVTACSPNGDRPCVSYP